jgi:hypothetical protein
MVMSMTSTLRQQIDELEPLRYARAAKRAALLAKELAEKADTEVSPAINHLVKASVEEIAAERMRAASSRTDTDASPKPSRGGNGPTSAGVRAAEPLDLTATREAIQEGMASIVQALQTMPAITQAMLESTSSLTELTRAIRDMPSFSQPEINLPELGRALKETARFTVNIPSKTLISSPDDPGTSVVLAGDSGFDWSEIGSPVIVTHGYSQHWSDLAGLLQAWDSHIPQDLLTDGPILQRGDKLTSIDSKWSAGRLIEDGNLFGSVRGYKPWLAPLEDDDIVRVDRSGGFMLIESRHRRPRWLAGVLHRQAVDTKFFQDGLVLLLRVAPASDVSDWAASPWAPRVPPWGSADLAAITVRALFDRPASQEDDPDQLAIPLESCKPPLSARRGPDD